MAIRNCQPGVCDVPESGLGTPRSDSRIRFALTRCHSGRLPSRNPAGRAREVGRRPGRHSYPGVGCTERVL